MPDFGFFALPERVQGTFFPFLPPWRMIPVLSTTGAASFSFPVRIVERSPSLSLFFSFFHTFFGFSHSIGGFKTFSSFSSVEQGFFALLSPRSFQSFLWLEAACTTPPSPPPSAQESPILPSFSPPFEAFPLSPRSLIREFLSSLGTEANALLLLLFPPFSPPFRRVAHPQLRNSWQRFPLPLSKQKDSDFSSLPRAVDYPTQNSSSLPFFPALFWEER